MTNTSAQIQPTTEPTSGLRSIRDIVADLSKPVNPARLKSKPATKNPNGPQLQFLPWHQACNYLDKFAPGWRYEIKSVAELRDMCVVTVRLIIVSSEGETWREATGIEPFDVKGYGDAVSNACSMALRRACAAFGLARHLYDKN